MAPVAWAYNLVGWDTPPGAALTAFPQIWGGNFFRGAASFWISLTISLLLLYTILMV